MNPSFPRGFSINPPYHFSFSPYSSPASSFSSSPISSFSSSPLSYYSSFTPPYFVVNNAPPKQARQYVSPAISPVTASNLNPYQASNWEKSSRYLKGQGIDVDKQKFGEFQAKRVENRIPNKTEIPKKENPPKINNNQEFSSFHSILKTEKPGLKTEKPEEKSSEEIIREEGLKGDKLNFEKIIIMASQCHGNPKTIISTILNTYGESKEALRFTNSFKSYLKANEAQIVTKESFKEFIDSFEGKKVMPVNDKAPNVDTHNLGAYKLKKEMEAHVVSGK